MNGRLTRPLAFLSLALGLIVGAFYFPMLVGQQAFYQSDLTYYFEPQIRFICDGLRQGRLPMWNPYLYCGMAQVAVPSPGMFYPFILCFLFTSFSQGMALYLVLHQIIAGVGAFLLVTALGWGVFAGVMAALACALCGYMFALQANLTLVATVAWLPLLLYALYTIDGTFTTRNVFRVILAAVANALFVGAGRPELSVPGELIAGILVAATTYGAWRDPTRPSGNSNILARLGFQILGLFLGGMVAMPVILPAIEWARVSPRAKGLALRWVLMWSANWYDCLGMVCGQPLGDLTRLGTKFLNMAASRRDSLPYVTSTYLGAVVWTFAFWGGISGRGRWRWIALAIGLGTLIMALGNQTPIAPWICKLSPAFAAFRYPVKLMVLPMLAVVLFAAHGASVSVEKRISTAALRTTAIIWALFLLTGLVFLAVPSLAELPPKFPWNAGIHVRVDHMVLAERLFGQSFVLTAAAGLLTQIIYIAFAKDRISIRWYQTLCVGALIGNLLWPSCLYLRHGTTPDFYERPSALAPILKHVLDTGNPTTRNAGNQKLPHRALTLYFDPLTPGPTYIDDQKLGFQQGFYLFARHLLLPNNNLDFRIPFAFGYEAAEVGDFKTLFSDSLGVSSQNRASDPRQAKSDAPIARFCRITGVSVALTQNFKHQRTNMVAPLDPKFFELKSVDPAMNIRMYSPRSILPRAYFAQSVEKATWKQFYALMLDQRNDVIPTQTFVDDDMQPVENESASPIFFITDEADRVALSVERTKPGLLVLSDQFYPGWTARIDGAPTKIYRINFFARGVLVPPGRHSISFEYKPASIAAGLMCAIGALFVLWALAAWSLLRRQPPNRAASAGPSAIPDDSDARQTPAASLDSPDVAS